MSDEEPEPQGYGCAAVTVIAILTAVPLAALWLISRDLFIVAVWVVAWWMVIRAARKSVPGTPDPAPPPPPERGSEEEPQVTMVRDTAHPNRWNVARPSPWMTYRHESRDES